MKVFVHQEAKRVSTRHVSANAATGSAVFRAGA